MEIDLELLKQAGIVDGEDEDDDSGGGLGGRERESQATTIVKLALQNKVELFHDGDNCYAVIRVAEHYETHALKSKAIRRWLISLYYEQFQRAPSAEAVRNAIDTLSGHAFFRGAERKTHIRVASFNGKLYLDLCNKTWQAIEISAAGWRIIESTGCPVRFRRAHAMQALPIPERNGCIAELRHYVNVASDDDFILLVAWLIGCYRDHGPYPVLIFHGEQGTAKTTLARLLRALVDPSASPARAEPREQRDLMIAANNGWIICYDNLSRLHVWLSDALCRLATGGGFSTRELYSDQDEVIFEAQRPALLNGIEELAARGDLLERAIILYLQRIPEDKRRTEEEFWSDFDATKPRILGALLDCVSSALAHYATTKLTHLPRMADFARWATAAVAGGGWEPGAFDVAYRANRGAAIDLTLEASVVASVVRALELPVTAIATKLLAILEQNADEKTKRSKAWPATGRALSNALRRLAPALMAAGIEVSFSREAHTGNRLITLAPSGGKSSSPSSPSSQTQGNQGFWGDESGDTSSGYDASSPSPSASSESATNINGFSAGDEGDARKTPI